ncbi:MAG: tyrosine-type recombinase/integrase, partial [Fuerstiella sp.]|nr:tyrosine-type recombinase/integrase [Fuerstiella sp.]
MAGSDGRLPTRAAARKLRYSRGPNSLNDIGGCDGIRRISVPTPSPAGASRLPTVLGGEEVTSLLSCVKSLKHRTFLLTLYAAGLRLSEAADLTIADIDSQRMQLRIAHGKGAKERLVPLSPRLLNELRDYWTLVRSPKYLFPG